MEQAISSPSFLVKIYHNKVVRFFLSAGIATFVDVLIYFFTITFILENEAVMLFGYPASAHEFSLLISYTCGVIANFLLAKYAVFNDSTLAGRKQFSRFALIAGIGFFANYGLLRFFVEVLEVWPTLARIFSALSLGLLAYYIHKIFTFKVHS
ncbi:MAG: GtrA family protein [Pelobium sp.]